MVVHGRVVEAPMALVRVVVLPPAATAAAAARACQFHFIAKQNG